jgi:hypothetical protein
VGADALKHLETGDSDPYLFLPRSGSFFDENMLLPSPQSDVYISPCLLELHSSRLRMLLMWLRAHKKKRDAYANEEYAQCAPGPRVRAIRGASTDDEHVGNHEQQSRKRSSAAQGRERLPAYRLLAHSTAIKGPEKYKYWATYLLG